MIVPQEIYHPLYEDKEKFIILITGGRGSGKSFNASRGCKLNCVSKE